MPSIGLCQVAPQGFNARRVPLPEMLECLAINSEGRCQVRPVRREPRGSRRQFDACARRRELRLLAAGQRFAAVEFANDVREFFVAELGLILWRELHATATESNPTLRAS